MNGLSHKKDKLQKGHNVLTLVQRVNGRAKGFFWGHWTAYLLFVSLVFISKLIQLLALHCVILTSGIFAVLVSWLLKSHNGIGIILTSTV